GDANQHVRIRADAVAPALGDEDLRVEYAVAEICLGNRAKSGDRPGQRKALGLALGHEGRMNEAPSPADRRVVEEELDRPRAQGGKAILNFGHLFGRMDMDRSVAG